MDLDWAQRYRNRIDCRKVNGRKSRCDHGENVASGDWHSLLKQGVAITSLYLTIIADGNDKMNQGPNRIFDEFAKLMTDAAGAAQGVKREAETAFKSQAERFLADMDLVKRDDFDAVQEMAANARAENENLLKRLESLETRIEALEKKKPATSRASTTKKSK